MRVPFICLLLLTAVSTVHAQQIIFQEDFESGSLGPGWQWNGSDPVLVSPGYNSTWCVRKESAGLSDPPLSDPLTQISVLFHPLEYIPGAVYHVDAQARVSDEGGATAAGCVGVGWIDMMDPNPSLLCIGGCVNSTIWQFAAPLNGSCDWSGGQFGVAIFVGPGAENWHVFVDAITVWVETPNQFLYGKALLDGAFDSTTGLMRDALRSSQLIPTIEPYSAIHGGPGGETVTPAVLAVSGPNAIVDWVRLELHTGDPANPTIAGVRHALIQRDGDIVEVDGYSQVAFSAPRGSYRVVLRHRNHLHVMTSTILPLLTPNTIDFTLPFVNCYIRPAPNTDLPRKCDAQRCLLWAGNALVDDRVKYTGTGNDRDAILQAIGGVVPTAVLSAQYRVEDANLDGVVKYTGTDNDRDIILNAIGGTTPTAVRVQQVP